ncbi:hypothetical protein LguiB_021400 [Lonicera macranthoides]
MIDGCWLTDPDAIAAEGFQFYKNQVDGGEFDCMEFRRMNWIWTVPIRIDFILEHFPLIDASIPHLIYDQINQAPTKCPTKADIYAVIKAMCSDAAVGPDGFDGFSIKNVSLSLSRSFFFFFGQQQNNELHREQRN